MTNTLIAIIVSLVALLVSTIAFPQVLRFAKRHNIVDNPNARKLQRIPIPVLGGTVVFMGIIAGSVLLSFFLERPVMIWGLVTMFIMLIVGTWDDMKDISALLRLIIEIGVVSAFMFLTGYYIDDFHGLWGVNELSPVIAIPFSIFVGVGVINAVNLIDGVDGYSSGYGIMACGCFALMFSSVWTPSVLCMTLVLMASLIPFFLHNVFGVKSKMFIGDGGTLMLGMAMVVLSFYSISSKGPCAQLAEKDGAGLAAFCLAVLCIPVFDTLRVMTARILRGKSPFSPDKTHLHHLFIDMGFSHLGAAAFIIFINFLVVLTWYMMWKLGVSIEVQTYAVVLIGLLVTSGFYKFMKMQQNGGELDEEGYPLGTPIWHAFCKLGDWSHVEKGVVWKFIRKMMDSKVLTEVPKIK